MFFRHIDQSRSVLNNIYFKDPVLSHLTPQYQSLDIPRHYYNLSKMLWARIQRANETGYLPQTVQLELPSLLAFTLYLKSKLRQGVLDAYRTNSERKLAQFARGPLQRLVSSVEMLARIHRRNWMNAFKPYGWEVIDGRYGALRARLLTLQTRLLQCCRVISPGNDDRLVYSYLEKIFSEEKSCSGMLVNSDIPGAGSVQMLAVSQTDDGQTSDRSSIELAMHEDTITSSGISADSAAPARAASPRQLP